MKERTTLDPRTVRCGKYRQRRSWLTLATVVVAFQLLSSPAGAHSDLVGSTPTSGAVLSAAPESVELVFAAGVQPQGGAIQVTGPDGGRLDIPDTFAASGNKASVSVGDPRATGAYKVTYRIVSADGHAIGDSFSYRLTQRAVNFTESGLKSDAPSEPRVESPTPTTQQGGGPGAGVFVVLGVAFLLLAVVVGVGTITMRRRDDSTSQP